MFVFFYLLDLESFKKIFHVLYRSKAKNGVIYGFPQIIYTNYILMVLSYIKIKVISFCEIKASLIRKINQEGGELGFWKTFLITTNLIIIRHKYKIKKNWVRESKCKFYSGSTPLAYIHSSQAPIEWGFHYPWNFN